MTEADRAVPEYQYEVHDETGAIVKLYKTESLGRYAIPYVDKHPGHVLFDKILGEIVYPKHEEEAVTDEDDITQEIVDEEETVTPAVKDTKGILRKVIGRFLKRK